MLVIPKLKNPPLDRRYSHLLVDFLLGVLTSQISDFKSKIKLIYKPIGSKKLPKKLQKIQVFVQKLGLKHPFSGQPTNRAASFLAFWNRHGPHLTRIAHWKAKSIGFQN